jgi:hypothetical protein
MSLRNLINKAKKEVLESQTTATPVSESHLDAATDDEKSCFTCSIHDAWLCTWPESRFHAKETFLRGCTCKNYRPAGQFCAIAGKIEY